MKLENKVWALILATSVAIVLYAFVLKFLG